MTIDWESQKQRYYAISLDPVHVGTGGYRLGRVDLTIIREPGTNLPKIPGSSLAGVARAYTAIATNKYRHADPNDRNVEFMCAGKGGGQGEKHCGDPACAVCTTYGFSKGEKGSSFQGLAQFFDARILLFPVYSMVGPVWVTCPSVWSDASGKTAPSAEQDKVHGLKFKKGNEDCAPITLPEGKLNLGWLLLGEGSHLTSTEALDTTKWKNAPDIPKEILERAVLVSDKLFPRIVNDNLEVRTSVAIDPATGAAESGALYSYEAIPRATVLWFDVVFNDPKFFRIGTEHVEVKDKNNTTKDANKDAKIEDIKNNVYRGLELMEFLGVGGMGTRGMGRLRILK